MEQEEYDQERTDYLKSQGYTVIRFWNNDIINKIESVMIAINQALENKS